MTWATISRRSTEFFHNSTGSTRPAFALIATISVMVLLVVLAMAMLSLSTLEQRSALLDEHMKDARANARLALMIALGELQMAAGPDQRVTATAAILGDSNNGYSNGTVAVNGKRHWLGVWDTSTYSPASPNLKTFNRWLVSSADQSTINTISAASIDPEDNYLTIFEGVDRASDVVVPKVQVGVDSAHSSYYAYWVEDEGVKADLAWSETPALATTGADLNRAQERRLAATPGVDHQVFGGPFNSVQIQYPIKQDGGSNDYLQNLQRAFSSVDMPLVVGDTAAYKDWLKINRHNMSINIRGVLADVKNGGLRRDLSMAFEMDGSAESESASLFNRQEGEFTGGSDGLSASRDAPGTSMRDRYLFRDFPTAGNPFSSDITVSKTFVRGPSWWLMRDYANLYKRLKKSGSGFAFNARSYYPNRGQAEDLFDIHAHKNRDIPPKDMVLGINRETSISGAYSYRPIRASYAPVLLGVNAIYSLAYTGNQLKLVVDPFFIIWNPYDAKITAPAFAVTLENGFIGGIRFKITDADGKVTEHGKPSRWATQGTDTSFTDYAVNRTGGNANLSYLLKGLSMEPGEVLVYSPPRESARSADANVTNDELKLGINYGAISSGIFFNEFPDKTGKNWRTIPVNPNDPDSRTPNIDPAKLAQCRIEVMFNVLSQNKYAILNYVETSLPTSDKTPSQLNTETNFGNQIQGKEFRINLGGAQHAKNIDRGKRGFSHSYNFAELGESKKPFGISSILVMSTDHNANKAYNDFSNIEVFSQLNATATVSTNGEVFHYSPMNTAISIVPADGLNNLMNEIGVDLSAYGSGSNAFYGNSYSLSEGDSKFPLLSIPKNPMISLIQLSGANIGTRLLEPTHAIGNSWVPPYIPKDSIYDNTAALQLNRAAATQTTSDTSWLINDALFDRYYFSGIAPDFAIGPSGYRNKGSLSATLTKFYSTNYKTAQANPVLQPYIPDGKASAELVTELSPSPLNSDGYKKISAYSLIKGAFNVNSTSVSAWSAFLRGNKALAIKSNQGTTDSGTGTPFPLSSSTSNTSSNNGWENFSRLTDDQIDLLAVKIVDQVKARGPFMSISDFVNRRIASNASAYQGAIQAAIEAAKINDIIRSSTSQAVPNYNTWTDRFPFATSAYIGNRNNATGIPLEVNQANILLPIAPKLSARSDTFRIRAYGEVRDSNGKIIAEATCEAVVQRLPEYVDTQSDSSNNEPWDDDSLNSTLNTINKTYGRRFEISSFRWLVQ